MLRGQHVQRLAHVLHDDLRRHAERRAQLQRLRHPLRGDVYGRKLWRELRTLRRGVLRWLAVLGGACVLRRVVRRRNHELRGRSDFVRQRELMLLRPELPTEPDQRNVLLRGGRGVRVGPRLLRSNDLLGRLLCVPGVYAGLHAERRLLLGTHVCQRDVLDRCRSMPGLLGLQRLPRKRRRRLRLVRRDGHLLLGRLLGPLRGYVRRLGLVLVRVRQHGRVRGRDRLRRLHEPANVRLVSHVWRVRDRDDQRT